MKAKVSNPVKPRQWKLLTVQQLNAIDALIMGATDEEAAKASNSARQTVWGWRTLHVPFQIELQRRRADLYRSQCEKLRSLVAKAVSNIEQAIVDGDVRLSVELLRIVGIYGDAAMNHVSTDAGLQMAVNNPAYVLSQVIEQWLRYEAIPKTESETLNSLLQLPSPQYQQREAELRLELEREFLEPID
jgi:hypothetical protein